MNESSNNQFWSSVAASDSSHIFTSTRAGNLVHFYATAKSLLLLMDRRICCATAQATGAGNALPICRYAAVFLPANSQASGNPWIRAAILVVNRGIPTKSLAGAE